MWLPWRPFSPVGGASESLTFFGLNSAALSFPKSSLQLQHCYCFCSCLFFSWRSFKKLAFLKFSFHSGEVCVLRFSHMGFHQIDLLLLLCPEHPRCWDHQDLQLQDTTLNSIDMLSVAVYLYFNVVWRNAALFCNQHMQITSEISSRFSLRFFGLLMNSVGSVSTPVSLQSACATCCFRFCLSIAFCS